MFFFAFVTIQVKAFLLFLFQPCKSIKFSLLFGEKTCGLSTQIVWSVIIHLIRCSRLDIYKTRKEGAKAPAAYFALQKRGLAYSLRKRSLKLVKKSLLVFLTFHLS